MSKKVSGIYAIQCKVNGKYRIGHASDIPKRWSQYLSELRGNYSSITEMQNDYDLYGEDAFLFSVLERCPKYLYKEKENYYIIKFDAINFGYNTMLNDLDKPKKIRRGKEAVNYREERSIITSGENNGHATKLNNNRVFEILDMLEAGIDKKIIAEKYDIYPQYIDRIGKDRWVKTYQEWLEMEKENRTATFDDAPVLLTNDSFATDIDVSVVVI